jgi:superfamily II DNA or RNA helicase
MGNVTSKFNNVPENVKPYLINTLSYKVGGFASPIIEKFLYNPETNATYTGLVPHAIRIFQELGLKYSIVDRRVKHAPNANFKIVKPYTARDYQAEMINYASSREILQAATGAGKTYIISELIAKFNVKPVLIVVNKVSLAKQLQKEIGKFLGTKIGLVSGAFKDVQDITIATAQTIIDGSDLPVKAKAIFFDECHNIPSNTIFEIASRAINAYYRIGVSATPWRDGEDDILIEAALNIRKPHLAINASKLIAKGKLTPCTINFIPMPSGTEWLGDYSKTYNRAIVHNQLRNNVIVQLVQNSLKYRKAILILVSKVDHGNLLLQSLRSTLGLGNAVEFLSGSDDINERERVFNAVKAGQCKVLIGTTIADEGLDLPILDTLILAGGGKSSTKAFQRVGRVLRLYEGKKDAIVYDFLDSYKTFNNQALTRKALYETEPLWKLGLLKMVA